jgi:LacI family transcriptional regulator
MGRSVTLKDVAEHAGVSRTTASYVVMGTGRVSEKTRRRVQESMTTLGYVYNQGAAALRRQTGTTVGVVVTNIDNPFFGELLVGLESTLTEAGFLSLVVTTADDPARQTQLLRALREHQVAGLAIVPATGTTPQDLAEFQGWGIPHVLMTRYLPEIDAPYVGPDDRLGGRLAADHLLDLGCGSLAYIGGSSAVMSRLDRMRGVEEAAEGRGVTVLDVPSETSGEGGRRVGAELLARPRLPEGIVCHSDTVAMGLYRALRDAGKAEGVRVVGYDDIATAELWYPSLTSVSTDAAGMGRRAGESLLQVLTGAASTVESSVIVPRLIVRESSGAGPQPPS